MLQKEMRSLSAPRSWTPTTSETATIDGQGWIREFKISRKGRSAEMHVRWDPTEDGVKIIVDEYSDPDDVNSRDRQFDLTIDEYDDIRSKVHEVAETWIKAVDNDPD